MSLPGQHRIGINRITSFLQPLVEKGLKSVILFGVVDKDMKDSTGSFADKPESPVIKAVETIKSKYCNLIVICDVCLCAYTDHGHCGILNESDEILVGPTCERLAKISVAYAKAGCDIIAPSDMMDGRVKIIREYLNNSGFSESVSIMSYSAKYASNFYGPFRDAACSAPGKGDRKKYQLPYVSASLGIRAAIRDSKEGSDIIMIKPGVPYLDVVKSIHDSIPEKPIAVYHVSGEYAMLMKAAECGIVNLREASLELMTSFRRAGASIIISYLTPYLLSLDLENSS